MKYFKCTIIFILFVSIVNLHGYFFANETDKAFIPPNPCEGCKDYSTSSLGQLIIEAAGFFIQSNSQYQLFLKEVELSGIYGINQEAMTKALDNAITHMEMATETYLLLVKTTNNFEYNQTVLAALNHFDYTGYRDLNHLNTAIFKQVQQLLEAGDVRGSYYRFYTATEEILNRLRDIKNSMDTLKIPKIPECWRLNQLYQETQIFGQYTAEIFMNLKY